jgi:hypothetical protein
LHVRRTCQRLQDLTALLSFKEPFIKFIRLFFNDFHSKEIRMAGIDQVIKITRDHCGRHFHDQRFTLNDKPVSNFLSYFEMWKCLPSCWKFIFRDFSNNNIVGN